jgi:hypothetical protein
VKQFEYMQVAYYGTMPAFELNRYGQQGWGLVMANPENNGPLVYTFMRELPVSLSLSLPGPTRTYPDVEPHEHQARASRKDPVVDSSPLTETDTEDGQ